MVQLLFGLLLLLLFRAESEAATLYFSPPNGSLTEQCHYAIDIRLNTFGMATNAADILVLYDPSKIEILDSDPTTSGVQIDPGDVFPTYFGNQVDVNSGEIRLTGGNFGGLFTGEGVFATIQFMSEPGATSADFDIYFTGADPYNSLDSNVADALTSNDLLTSAIDGSFTFAAGSCPTDNTPPGVTFIVPAPNQTGVGPNSNIQLRVSDSESGVDINTVEIVLNGVRYITSDYGVGTSGDPSNYLISIDPNEPIPQNGPSVLLIRATDFAGNFIQSYITFNLPAPSPTPGDRTSPEIIFIDPEDRSNIEPGTDFIVSISDDESGVDINSIQLIINGEIYTVDNEQFSYTGDQSLYQITLALEEILDPGSYTLTVFAQDLAGNGSLQSALFTVLGEDLPITPEGGVICYDIISGDLVDPDSLCKPKSDRIIIEIPVKEEIVRYVENLNDSTIASTTLSLALLGLFAFDSLPGLLLRAFFGLLKLLGLRSEGIPYGYVYDSITKEPISQAIVRIYDNVNKLVRTDVTDFNGIFTAELRKGMYKMSASKAEYKFPSKVITTSKDGDINNIYHGEQFQLSDSSEIDFSIPIDRIEGRWLKRLKEWLKNYLLRYLYYVLNLLYFIGAISSAVLLLLSPSTINTITFLIYIVAFFINRILRKVYSPHYGKVKNQFGEPVANIIVGLYESADGALIAKRVTDHGGRYRFIANKGRYLIKLINDDYQLMTKIEDVVIKRDQSEVGKELRVRKKLSELK